MRNSEALWEPNSTSGFLLAYERLEREDEARSEWLKQRCAKPDEDESDAPVLELKIREVAPGRCGARYCNRSARALGLCDKHYRQARRQGLTEAEFRATQREQSAA